MNNNKHYTCLLAVGMAVERVRFARGKLRNHEVGGDIAGALALAEFELRLAEGELARDAGIGLCPDCWPPELLVADNDGHWNCRSCSRQPALAQGDADRRVTQEFALWQKTVADPAPAPNRRK